MISQLQLIPKHWKRTTRQPQVSLYLNVLFSTLPILQESFFHYLFGASQYADCYGTLSIPGGEATLFVPSWGIEVETVCGPSPRFDAVKKELGIENVHGVSDLKNFIEMEMERSEDLAEEKKDGASPPKLLLLSGLNTDSGNMAMPASFKGIEQFNDARNDETLFKHIVSCRVTKSKPEIDVMTYTNWISSMAHVDVMRACKPCMMEYQLESLFQHHTYTHGGCRHMSYTCIW